MISTFLSTLLGKLAIATMAVAAAGGGLAASDNLPDSAQEWVSEAVSHVGIDLPTPSDADLPSQTDGVEAPDALELSEDASDTADAVIETVFDGDSADGADFGTSVADTASDGNAEDSGVADDYTDGAGDQAGDSRP